MRRLCAFILLSLTAYSSIAQEVNNENISVNKYTTGINYLKAEVIKSNNQHVTVSVRWDKSWRDSENWDAAWIVLKGYKNGNASEHIMISEKPEVVSNNSSDGASAEIYVPEDRAGFFIYRSEEGEGDNSWTVEIPFKVRPVL